MRTLRDEREGHGYIVRTNAEGVNDFALSADMVYLGKVWQAIVERATTAPAATCIFEDLSLSLRALRDMMHEQVDRVRIDSPRVLSEVRDFARRFVPDWLERIEEYSADRPIFDLFGVEDEIESALRASVPLKSGGYLVFDQTEAMTTVDVNTGGFVGHRTVEETIYKTNLEADPPVSVHILSIRGGSGRVVVSESEKPVWLCIENENVTIKDAKNLWGKGIYNATEVICNEMGPGTQVAAAMPPVGTIQLTSATSVDPPPRPASA